MEINKWDLRFLNLANLIGSWSKDPKTKVGAVITDNQHRVISLGYNGYPFNIQDTIVSATREEKLLKVIHAEENALLFRNSSVKDCTIYITHPPCPNCTSKILQVGISKIVTIEATKEHLVKWGDKHIISLAMIKEANVEYVEYSTKDIVFKLPISRLFYKIFISNSKYCFIFTSLLFILLQALFYNYKS